MRAMSTPGSASTTRWYAGIDEEMLLRYSRW